MTPAPIIQAIDKMWTDFERDQRARYPEVYALGERLIREREAMNLQSNEEREES